MVSRRVHRAPPKSNTTRCTVQKAPREPTVYPGSASAQRGQRIFEDAEGAFECQNQRDKTELPEFYADIESDQRQWQFMPRKSGAGECAGEAESVQQPKRKRHHPGMANR